MGTTIFIFNRTGRATGLT